MKIRIDDKDYNVIITRKAFKKNITIRLKDDMNFYVSCNMSTPDFVIKNLFNDSINSIRRMIKKVSFKVSRHEEEDNNFYYLGKKFDIVYLNQKGLTMTYDKVFVPQDFDFDKWYLKEAKKIFKDELDRIYNSFVYEIPYPSLTIRKMKTRWGVCNYKTKRVTLNFNLIKKDIKYLDYVIVHELSHLLYHDHGKCFWKCVEANMPEYKDIRKDLKDYE